jgi:D-inositol-3-phosphate glycosyltransferase
MRLLWVGDSPSVPTGFAQVTRNVCGYLSQRGWEVHVLGVQYDGSAPLLYPYAVHPASSPGDLCGFHRIADYASELKPDVLMLFGDIWVVAQWRQRTKHLGIPTLVYTPVDGEGYSQYPQWLDAVDGCSLYTYSEYGLRELLSAGATQVVGILPHGADDRTFYPDVPAREKFRLDANAFVVLNANRNQPRKRIDLTIQGFCLFASNLPPESNVKLWLHMGLKDHGWDIIRCFDYWASHYQLPDDGKYLYLTHNQLYHPTCDVATVADIYRSVDVVVNTSLGEGWGLIAHEAALCGIPQIVPNNTVSAELWRGAADLIDCPTAYHCPENGLVYYVPSASSLAEKLLIHYWHREHREQMGKLARQRALQYTWERVLPQFENALAEAAGVLV